jgi:hypothetical protein
MISGSIIIGLATGKPAMAATLRFESAELASPRLEIDARWFPSIVFLETDAPIYVSDKSLLK